MVVMLETSEFLQEQAIQCNALAASAVDGSVREFWLRSARRWLEILRPRRGYEKLYPTQAGDSPENKPVERREFDGE
jgi:hypothetical protein